MKRLLILAAVIAMALPVAAQTTETYPSYIEVTGYAEKKVLPDEFLLGITITEKESKGKISVEQQQAAMVAALNGLGIDVDKQLQVSDMTSIFYKKNNSLATAEYQLKLTGAETVGKVYAALDEAGISNIALLRTSYSKYDELKAQLRNEAIVNAKNRAQALAEAIGQGIGDCFYINDWERTAANNAAVVTYGMARSMKAADQESSTPLEFKKITVSYSVNAKFVLRGTKGRLVVY